MIRYNKELVNNINKTVQNYNAKIRRLQKLNPSLSLPEKISAKSLRNMSDTRQELNRNLQKLKRFSKRGSEKNIILPSGEIISKYELNELKRESSRLQRNLTRRINELAEITPKVKGVKQDYNYAQMGDATLNNYIVKRDTLKNLTKGITKTGNLKNAIKYIQNIQKQQARKISVFRDNYINKMFAWQGYAIGYDYEKINEMKEKINKLSERDFLKFFDEERILKKIQEMYAVMEQATKHNYFAYEQEMTDIFDNLYNNLDDYLKDYKSYKK